MDLRFLGDLVGGYNQNLDQQRQTNQRAAELQATRDNAIFEALANSDDDDVRAAAVTGLLTQNHPAGFLGKFFQKVGEHPAYQTIKGLVAQGHQPMLGATEEKRREVEATRSGGITGAVSGATQAVPGISEDDKRRIAMGAAGAAVPTRQPQRGTLKLLDGSTAAGYFDVENKAYYDDNGQQRTDVAAFSPSGSFGAGAGGGSGNLVKVTAADFARQFPNRPLPPGLKPEDLLQYKVDAQGNPMGQPVITKAPTGGGESFQPVYTPGGIQRFGNKSGAVSEAPGGGGVQRPEAPAVGASAVRQIQDAILRLHPAPKGLIAGSPASPRQQAAWQAAVDAEAVKYGYGSFAALQQAIGSATGAVGAAVPQPPPAAPGGQPGSPPGAFQGPAPKKGQRVGDGPPPAAALPGAGSNPADPFDILH